MEEDGEEDCGVDGSFDEAEDEGTSSPIRFCLAHLVDISETYRRGFRLAVR